MARILGLLAMIVAAAAKKGDPPAPEPSKFETLLLAPVMDLLKSGLGVVTDVATWVTTVPRGAADLGLEAVDLLRAGPGLANNVFRLNKGTQDDLVNFCVSAATTAFAVYAALAALNLLLTTFCTVKDYFNEYMKIPTEIAGQKLPAPLADVINTINKEVLGRIKSFKTSDVMGNVAWVDGGRGPQGPGQLAKTSATAISLCMILSCAPSALALMRSGANKADAQALAWTLGTALGVKYLVDKH